MSVTPLCVPSLVDDEGPLDMLSAALAYASAGWYVGPLAPGSKSPGSELGKAWHTKTSRDPATLAAWFAGRGAGQVGLFLHLGRSGAVAIDVDTPDRVPDVLRQNLAGAPKQVTRSRDTDRAHYVFLQPPRLHRRHLLWKTWRLVAITPVAVCFEIDQARGGGRRMPIPRDHDSKHTARESLSGDAS